MNAEKESVSHGRQREREHKFVRDDWRSMGWFSTCERAYVGYRTSNKAAPSPHFMPDLSDE